MKFNLGGDFSGASKRMSVIATKMNKKNFNSPVIKFNLRGWIFFRNPHYFSHKFKVAELQGLKANTTFMLFTKRS